MNNTASQHKLFIETYGCQMNLNDTQIVQSIMSAAGYLLADSIDDADIILLNTCSVRENAEERVKNRIETLLHSLKKRKTKSVLGVLGCMAERLKESLFSTNEIISVVVGPDEYKKLPLLVAHAFEGEKQIAVGISKMETYDDIIPLQSNSISTWISIMRGCNNFCSYCIVPYTRGRERSRNPQQIIAEVKQLAMQGFKEITLLGQNVNSYNYVPINNSKIDSTSPINFPQLLSTIAQQLPNLRIRFLTSHPRNLSEELVNVVAEYENICNAIHLPVQSGSNHILEQMNRKYAVEHYLSLIELIRSKIPDCSISTDIIAGYPSETLEDHKSTLELMQKVRFNNAFMFRYSPRQGTKAFNVNDDVIEIEKIRRLNEIIALQNQISFEENQKDIGKILELLVEAPSKKNHLQWLGRTKTAKLVIFDNSKNLYKAGDFLNVTIKKATSATLFSE